MGDLRYINTEARKLEDFESVCRQCGLCCGVSDGDPCANLAEDYSGKYYCRDYENRLGPQKTVSEKSFTCVSIVEVKRKGALPSGCAYR